MSLPRRHSLGRGRASRIMPPCYTLAPPYNQPRRLETLVGSTPGVRVRNFGGGVLATQPLTLARCGVSLPRLPPGLDLLCCARYDSAWRHADRGSYESDPGC